MEIQASASTTSCAPCFLEPRWASTVSSGSLFAEEVEVVNVDVLDQMAGPDGKVEISEMKVLGRGKVTRKLEVSAAAFTVTAKNKIEAAGGQAVTV